MVVKPGSRPEKEVQIEGLELLEDDPGQGPFQEFGVTKTYYLYSPEIELETQNVSRHGSAETELFLELPLDATAPPAGLQALTDAELISLEDSQEKQAELERRLEQTPEVNQLAYRFLVVDEGEHDATLHVLEALVHLIENLLKEQRIRRTPRQPGDDSWKDTIREQIEMAICVQLLPVKSGRSAQEITLAALQGGFGDLDSRILSELKTEGNAHRQAVRTRRKPSITESPSLDFVIAVNEQGHQLSFGDTVGLETLIPRCALGSVSTLDEAIEFVTSNRQEIVDAIGRSSYGALLLFMEFAAREETTDLTCRESERTLTEYLQKRGVSPQQARKDKVRFRKAMSDALKAQNPAILDLTNLLRGSRKTIFEDLVS